MLNNAPAVINLRDGRPHTVGVAREPVPYGKTVTYQEAFVLTGSHVEARRMIDTQHRMLGESRVRDYENWLADQTNLVKQKLASKRWGTTGGIPADGRHYGGRAVLRRTGGTTEI